MLLNAVSKPIMLFDIIYIMRTLGEQAGYAMTGLFTGMARSYQIHNCGL